MKTTKITTVLSLVMFFTAVASAFAAGRDKLTNQQTVYGIRHQVNVIIANEKPLCNTYLIEIRDGQGQLIAPAQRYVSGITKYTFNERGPASGVRVALLKRANFGDHYICEYELFTTPVYVTGPFLIGQTYRFDLFPSFVPNKE
jgi:hypothetical protein